MLCEAFIPAVWEDMTDVNCNSICLYLTKNHNLLHFFNVQCILGILDFDILLKGILQLFVQVFFMKIQNVLVSVEATQFAHLIS